MSTIVITGASRGIGLELAMQYKARGDDVIVLNRGDADVLSQLGAEVHSGIDVTSDESVADFAHKMAGRQIDVLINNAGLLSRETLDDLNFDRMRAQYEVNALAPLRVTNALRANFKPGSKIAIVSSRVGSVEDNGSGGNYGYRMSKAAVNMAGANLAIDFKAGEIPVILLHPGYVKTDMTGNSGGIEPAVAANGLIQRIDDLSMATTGTFWHAEGYKLPW